MKYLAVFSHLWSSGIHSGNFQLGPLIQPKHMSIFFTLYFYGCNAVIVIHLESGCDQIKDHGLMLVYKFQLVFNHGFSSHLILHSWHNPGSFPCPALDAHLATEQLQLGKTSHGYLLIYKTDPGLYCKPQLK